MMPVRARLFTLSEVEGHACRKRCNINPLQPLLVFPAATASTSTRPVNSLAAKLPFR
jgi:hypothetical protein